MVHKKKPGAAVALTSASLFGKEETKRLALCGVKAYKLKRDSDQMLYVVRAGTYFTQWNDEKAARDLARGLARHIDTVVEARFQAVMKLFKYSLGGQRDQAAA